MRADEQNRMCYDVGRVMMGQNWRPVFNRDEVRRELEIITDDPHATARRICGQDLDRLTAAGEQALERGWRSGFPGTVGVQPGPNALDT